MQTQILLSLKQLYIIRISSTEFVLAIIHHAVHIAKFYRTLLEREIDKPEVKQSSFIRNQS